MLISSLLLPPNDFPELGLQEIRMTRLGRMVAIAGQNGAGKSRLLRALEAVVSLRTADNLKNPEGHRSQAEFWQAAITKDPYSENVGFWTQQRLKERLIYAACTELVGTPEVEPFRAVRFVPKVLKLDDPRNEKHGEIVKRSQDATDVGHNTFHSTTLFYIQRLLNEYHDVTHPDFDGSSEERTRLQARHSSFQEIVVQMLGQPIRRQVSTGYPLIFGMVLGDANLSDGQKVLLQLCVALHAQSQNLERTVLIFDEPENHLHPSAVVDVVKAIYNSTTSTQIWVATHSVPLLAYMSGVDSKCLWYMDKGAIAHAGKNPEIVLKSLLGGEDGIAELSAFASLPAELASVKFASESLLPPQVIGDGVGDPQVTQVQRQLQSLKSEQPLSILDFGAGRGRLLDGLAAMISEKNQSPEDILDYYAFDEYTDNHNQCINVIAGYFEEKNRLFHKEDDFFAAKDKGCISVVVMTNVLHEIPPRMWAGLFRKDSLIEGCLAEDGYLLIVEDQRIPTGEKAHEHGFLVLDTVHLKTMFGANEQDLLEKRFLVDDARGDGRLKAHLISKKLFANVSAASVRDAIEQLRSTSKREIQRLRRCEPSYHNGQLHGFWTQQFANTALVLEE
ncbi:AAA family ATPase [Burkholderia gladioli]|uniref:AAA family ATPase n=2 Tax=Burkholderia gladioli TaxID=28095 RepID=UPI000F0B462E|nr:AAA family ATPase [Burkholderia gladioli]AYQ89324.1 ATP-binding cassette domain-containing protein [Burkholderia gladioli]